MSALVHLSLLTAPDDDLTTLVDQLLQEQRCLTPVVEFAKKHDAGDLPAQARYYRSLIPATPLRPGEQFAFSVDLDSCTGCKARVSACHSLTGLDEGEMWRSVGLVVGEGASGAYQQTVTTACHHCAEPACMHGCPVMAYEKDEHTGIVRHLDDQCIGCQYCVLKCPYEVPKYSAKRGIVRKCDMCFQRLAVGEAPACVQACPNEAIKIEAISVDQVRARSTPGSSIIPGAFDSSYTLPTTTYRSERPSPITVRPADADVLHRSHAHHPLSIMLVFTQAAGGLSFAAAAAHFLGAPFPAVPALGIGAFLFLTLGLIGAFFHLGRPLGAWRFFLGLRTSWMSREILGFVLYHGATAGVAILGAWPWIVAAVPFLAPFTPWVALGQPVLLLAAVALALVSVGCSAMIYIDTARPEWAARWTGPRFLLGILVLGTTAAAAILHSREVGIAAIAALALQHFWRQRLFLRALADPTHPANRTYRLECEQFPRMQHWLRNLFWIATGAALIGVIFLSAAVFSVALGASLLACWLDRFLFFSASVSPKMPGGVTAGPLGAH